MKKRILMLLIFTSFMCLLFASECVSQKLKITGELRDIHKAIIQGGKITAIQDGTRTEQYATINGDFEIMLHPGKATLIYQAPGYENLEDTIISESVDNKRVKYLKRNSIGGWWTLLLLIPGIFGLLVAWCKECLSRNRIADHTIQDRLLVALFNGIVWAGVLAWIWYEAAAPGVTKLQFFSSSLTFEFFVPFLGYLGAMLYVFDLFRGKENDKFKEKEFGMRIVMGPYVAIIVVSLFGKNLSFVNLESQTGQGTLAFLSGLIVVVAFQGLIERANETLGKWRRDKNKYIPTRLAEKFKLTEEEDYELRRIFLRHPEQLSMWSEKELGEKVSGIAFDKHHLLKMKKVVDSEELTKNVGDLIWERLRMLNINTLQEFATLSNVEIQNFAKQKPELSDARVIEIRDKIHNYLNNNGGCS